MNFLNKYLSKEKDVTQQKGQNHQPSYPRYMIFYDIRLKFFDIILFFYVLGRWKKMLNKVFTKQYAKKKKMFIFNQSRKET